MGHRVAVGGQAAVEPQQTYLNQVIGGGALGDPATQFFRDPTSFCAGKLRQHYEQWAEIVGQHPAVQQELVLQWIQDGVSLFPHRHFAGKFKRQTYDSQLPPPMSIANNHSCKEFSAFSRRTLLDRLRTGAISPLGNVDNVPPPHLI